MGIIVLAIVQEIAITSTNQKMYSTFRIDQISDYQFLGF
jgi:hypothetical protein